MTVEALQWFSHKGPHSETSVPYDTSDGVLFPYQYSLYHVCGFLFLFLCIPFCLSVFHFVIREASGTSLSCFSSSSVTQDGTLIMIYAFRV